MWNLPSNPLLIEKLHHCIKIFHIQKYLLLLVRHFSSSSGRVSSGIHFWTRDTLHMKRIQSRISAKEETSLRGSSERGVSVFSDVVRRHGSAHAPSPASFSCRRGWIRYVELSFNDAESLPASLARQKFLPLCVLARARFTEFSYKQHVYRVEATAIPAATFPPACIFPFDCSCLKHFFFLATFSNSCLVCPLATMAVDCYRWCSCYSNNLMPR